MGRTAYPTVVTTISTDIELVGGKNATVGMIREDNIGRKYRLVQAAGEISSGCILVPAHTEASGATIVLVGANTTGSTVANGSYFWMQTYGEATLTTDESLTDKCIVTATTGGVATRDAVAGLNGGYYIGFALAADVGTSGSVFIDPGGAKDASKADA